MEEKNINNNPEEEKGTDNESATEEENPEEEKDANNESCTGATNPEDANVGEKKLTALAHILFESHQYKPGDELPTHNLVMNKAWVEAGTAAWLLKPDKAANAVPAVAETGLPGNGIPAGKDDLVGKVPKRGRKAGG